MQPNTTYVLPDPMMFPTELFWPFTNFDTSDLDWKHYAETFSDVAETDKHVNLNPFDFKLHIFEIAFYALAYHSIAKGGNCFGMCLESIYARDRRSLFTEPIFSSNAYHKDGMLLGTDNKQLNDSSNHTP